MHPRQPRHGGRWDGGDRGCDTHTFRYGAGFMKLCANTNHGTGKDAHTDWITA